jgi:hypothetical protein
VAVFAASTPSVDKGDLAFSFPLKLAGRLKRPPMEIAAEAAAAGEGHPGGGRGGARPPPGGGGGPGGGGVFEPK